MLIGFINQKMGSTGVGGVGVDRFFGEEREKAGAGNRGHSVRGLEIGRSWEPRD